jgi:hypothetical protein
MPMLQASDPLPGLRVRSYEDWAAVQQAMQGGATLTPLLPLGGDAAYVWVTKNGSSSLKWAWLQARFGAAPAAATTNLEIHRALQPHSHWLTPEQLQAVAKHRAIVAIWRDPIDRFVSACRSHLVELTSGRIRDRLQAFAAGDGAALEDSLAFHQDLFRRHGVVSFGDDCEPSAVMNQVALQLPSWIQCHLEWSHHVLPQVSFLGGDPSPYRTILGMEHIHDLIAYWQASAGVPLDASPRHVSEPLAAGDPWRCLQRDQLGADALAALERFYAADRAFLVLAQQQLGAWPGREGQLKA